MKIGTLTRERQADWAELDSLIDAARGRPERLQAEQILRLGRLYRSAVADLARLRSRDATNEVTIHVASLVGRARPLVYRSEPPSFKPLRFLTSDFWRITAERPVLLLVAGAVLGLTAALGWVWATVDGTAAVGMVPPEFASALDPSGGTDMGADLALQAEFSTFLITHNVTVAILAFAVGIFFGIGTVLVLAQNGLLLGVIGGALVAGGNGDFFIELVAAHGVLELSCIVVAAAAGLRLGWALVNPGDRSRRDSLVAEARPAVLMTVGVIPWLVVAGVIEAFVSRRGFAALPMAVVGATVGGLFWFLMWSRGARRQSVADRSDMP